MSSPNSGVTTNVSVKWMNAASELSLEAALHIVPKCISGGSACYHEIYEIIQSLIPLNAFTAYHMKWINAASEWNSKAALHIVPKHVRQETVLATTKSWSDLTLTHKLVTPPFFVSYDLKLYSFLLDKTLSLSGLWENARLSHLFHFSLKCSIFYVKIRYLQTIHSRFVPRNPTVSHSGWCHPLVSSQAVCICLINTNKQLASSGFWLGSNQPFGFCYYITLKKHTILRANALQI